MIKLQEVNLVHPIRSPGPNGRQISFYKLEPTHTLVDEMQYANGFVYLKKGRHYRLVPVQSVADCLLLDEADLASFGFVPPPPVEEEAPPVAPKKPTNGKK